MNRVPNELQRLAAKRRNIPVQQLLEELARIHANYDPRRETPELVEAA